VIARILTSLAVALFLFACASIDPPAAFQPPDASDDPSFVDSGARRCGRVLPRRFTTDAVAKIYGDPSGAQAVCVTVGLEVSGVSNSAVTFCVAGDLDDVSEGTVRDISPDPNKCAYCVDVRTSCRIADAGTETCDNAYAPLSGRVRIVRLDRAPGSPVWIDVGNLVVARVIRRDDVSFELERRDCLFADGLTFQGKLVAATCTNDTLECRIANSASSRFP
jgi:hypothetical protein